MYKILDKNKVYNDVYTMKFGAPRVAKSIKPGQFVMIRIDEKGERIPFSVCDFDKAEESVTIVFKAAEIEGKEHLSALNVGDSVMDFVGPLGQASFLINENIEELKNKRILFVAENSAAARVYPELLWLYNSGVLSDVLIGFSTREEIVFKKRIESAAKNVYISTEDGSAGIKGTIPDAVNELLNKNTYDYVIAMGSTEMMRDVAEVTKALKIKTIVSLSTLMLDGIGMCGACRLTVDGKVKFACQDGPEFDGHLVDYDEVLRRQNYYSSHEARAKFKAENGKEHVVQEAAVALEEDENE